MASACPANAVFVLVSRFVESTRIGESDSETPFLGSEEVGDIELFYSPKLDIERAACEIRPICSGSEYTF